MHNHDCDCFPIGLIVFLGLLLLLAFLFIRGYIRSRKYYCTATPKSMQRLFRKFPHKEQLNMHTSEHACWIADGGPGIGGRTYFVEKPRELGLKVMDFLRSRGFEPREVSWANKENALTLTFKELGDMDNNIALIRPREQAV